MLAPDTDDSNPIGLMSAPSTSGWRVQSAAITADATQAIRVLVLSEDEHERELLLSWSKAMGTDIAMHASGIDLLGALQISHELSKVQDDSQRSHSDLIVLGGQLPPWVYLDLIERVKLRVNRASAVGIQRSYPSFLLLLNTDVIDQVFTHISAHHSDLRIDFAARPLRIAEFDVRAKRLLLGPNNGIEWGGRPKFPPIQSNQFPFGDPAQPKVVSFGPYRFDFKRHSVSLHDEVIRLSYREFTLTWALFSMLGEMVSRDDLLQRLNSNKVNTDSSKHSRSLDSYISRIRHSLKIEEKHGYTLDAVYGQGYVIRTA